MPHVSAEVSAAESISPESCTPALDSAKTGTTP